MFYLLNFKQYVLLGWRCEAIQFPSMTTNSKHHNLTFHSSCNVLYHPSTSSITPLIWLSFLPQNPKSHFPFFHISLHINTRWCRESSHVERDTKQRGVAFIFFSFTICSHLLFLYSFASLVYFHIVQFFSSFFLYNFLLFDSLLLFGGDDVVAIVAWKQNSRSWIPFFKVRSCYLIFFPSCLSAFPFVWFVFLIYKF